MDDLWNSALETYDPRWKRHSQKIGKGVYTFVNTQLVCSLQQGKDRVILCVKTDKYNGPASGFLGMHGRQQANQARAAAGQV